MTGTSMNITPDNQWIDDLRRRIQAALNDSKRDVLREQYGMLHEHHSPDLSSEMESEWLDYVLEFERQFENAPRTTVRARIGDPPLPPIDALTPDDLVAATDALVDLLAAHYIAVDFLGDVEYETVYRYLTEELLDEEIDDIRIPELWLNFTYATDAYNSETWVGEFVDYFFAQHLEFLLSCMDDKRLWTDMGGQRLTMAELKALWARLPVTRDVQFEVLETDIVGDEGRLLGRVIWQDNGATHTIKATFQVRRSRYLDEAWSIEQTSLVDQLCEMYG